MQRDLLNSHTDCHGYGSSMPHSYSAVTSSRMLSAGLQKQSMKKDCGCKQKPPMSVDHTGRYNPHAKFYEKQRISHPAAAMTRQQMRSLPQVVLNNSSKG